jgi:hypothetical protein
MEWGYADGIAFTPEREQFEEVREKRSVVSEFALLDEVLRPRRGHRLRRARRLRVNAT